MARASTLAKFGTGYVILTLGTLVPSSPLKKGSKNVAGYYTPKASAAATIYKDEGKVDGNGQER